MELPLIITTVLGDVSPLILLVRGLWVFAITFSLFALVPSPFQHFLRTCYMRGKHLSSPSPKSWPPKFTVPHSFFNHFYIIGVVMNTCLLCLFAFHVYSTTLSSSPSMQFSTFPGQMGGSDSFSATVAGESVSEVGKYNQKAWRTVLLLLLLEMQVVRRLYESLYVSKYSPLSRMHVMAYLTGLVYYVLAPLSLCSPKDAELLINSIHNIAQQVSRQGAHESGSEVPWWIYVKVLLKIGWLPWIGAVIFLWGWTHQYKCHMILASLKSKDESKIGHDDKYRIPYGDWFEYVSSAHYLAEIVIYSSFVIATAGQELSTWLLLIFVVINLSVAAIDTHNWYLSKFEDYPSKRWAVCPFIY